MKIQEELRQGMSLDYLKERLGIMNKRHKEFPQLVLLKYHMIDSPMGNPLVQECRGVILDEKEDWRVICRPFDKFFNWGEGHAKEINWKNAKVQEKLDGSLMTIYWYEGKWRVSSSGTPDASGAVNDYNMTFEELFWRAFKAEGYQLPAWGMQDLNFMFEMTGPHNRVVIPHAETHLTLIGVRNRFAGHELPLHMVGGLGYRPVKSFPLQTIEQVVETFQQMDPLKQEGYVVVDDNFHRVKVKHPGYIALHHMKGETGQTPKRMLEIARSGEGAELIAHFPEWKPMFEDVKIKLDALVVELEAVYVAAKQKVDAYNPPLREKEAKKEFASHVLKSRLSAACFALYGGKTPSIRQFLADMTLDTLVKVLGLKDEPTLPASD